MKYLLLFAFFIGTSLCYGQQIRGRVVDMDTKLPVNGAIVTMGNHQAFTNYFGEFSITASGNDSLKIARFGYNAYKILITNLMAAIRVELEPAKMVLNEVVIHANREGEFKKDSAENRRFYDKQFNYKGPTVMDALKGAPGNPVKNTSQLLNIDVITLIRALTKRAPPSISSIKHCYTMNSPIM